MKLQKSLSLSLKNIMSTKRRSFLTMLGIMIGVFAVAVVMSVGAGVQGMIVNQIASRGTDQIAILAGASDESGPPAQAFGIVITTLTREDAESLLKKSNASHIKTVNAAISGNDILTWRDKEEPVTYTGTLSSYEQVENVTIADGQFFTVTQEHSAERVIVLGASIAKDIFGNQDPVGQQVKLKRLPFNVIGVLAPKGSSPFEDPDNAVLIPLKTAQQDLLGVRHVSFIRAQVTDEQYISQTVEEVRQTLIERHGEEDFSVRNISDALDIVTTITNAMKFFLIAIAGIALFVGGVGIMNIMLIAVKEKTREIGIRKACGATDKDIYKQFLIESVVLSSLGALIGLIFGVFLSYMIALGARSAGLDYPFSISIPMIFIAMTIAIGIGIAFGVVPAGRAAKLNPIEALRYE